MALHRLSPERLAEILVHLGVAKPEEIAPVLSKSRTHSDLLTGLADKGVAKEEDLLKALSASQNIPYFKTFSGLIDPAAARLVPEPARADANA